MAGGGKIIKTRASKQVQISSKKVSKANAKKSKKPTIAKPKRVKAHVQRALKNKEPKLVENTKAMLVMRGNKTSEEVNQLLRDLVSDTIHSLFV
jgi:ribosome production factor 2